MINKSAQALGRLARGKNKKYSPKQLKIRAARLAEARKKRWMKNPLSESSTDLAEANREHLA